MFVPAPGKRLTPNPRCCKHTARATVPCTCARLVPKTASMATSVVTAHRSFTTCSSPLRQPSANKWPLHLLQSQTGCRRDLLRAKALTAPSPNAGQASQGLEARGPPPATSGARGRALPETCSLPACLIVAVFSALRTRPMPPWPHADHSPCAPSRLGLPSRWAHPRMRTPTRAPHCAFVRLRRTPSSYPSGLPRMRSPARSFPAPAPVFSPGTF